jgi:hypothetical protein
VAGQQKVGNTLLDGVLVPTVTTNEFSLRHLSLEKKMVKILEGLLISPKLNCCGRLFRELRETQL